jgi:hypothetical protein
VSRWWDAAVATACRYRLAFFFGPFPGFRFGFFVRFFGFFAFASAAIAGGIGSSTGRATTTPASGRTIVIVVLGCVGTKHGNCGVWNMTTVTRLQAVMLISQRLEF